MLDALAPARRRFVLGVGALVALVLLATAVVLGLSARGGGVTPVAQDAQPPVLLVPGYGGSTTSLTVLADALREDGRTVQVVDLGQESRGDLHAQARMVDDAVRAVLTAADASSVDLVGYSAGGVTLRVWMGDHDGGEVARRVVTLGSPHHGTEVAGLAADLAPDRCPRACQQLAPDSTLIRDLNSDDETPDGPIWVSIWTDQDRIVIPPSSSTLQGALAFSVQSVCPADRVTHGRLPADPAVIAMTLLALGRDDPVTPDVQVCTA
jgi:triacylglycerol lipase